MFNGERTSTRQAFWFLFFFAEKVKVFFNVYDQFGYGLILHLLFVTGGYNLFYPLEV